MNSTSNIIEIQPLHDREVDEGLTSGYTMLAAIEALRKSGTQQIVVAVPTGQIDTTRHIAGQVDTLYRPNVRERRQFADAYLSWSDVEEDTALRLLQREQEQTQAAATVT